VRGGTLAALAEVRGEVLGCTAEQRSLIDEALNAGLACNCDQIMRRIGEDVVQKLDYEPRVFTVERRVRRMDLTAPRKRHDNST
jgi:hypothetical protein